MDVQQRWMDLLTSHGSALLKLVIGNSSNNDSDDDNEDQMMMQFLKWKIDEVMKTFEPKFSLKPDPLIAMPPEMYRGRATRLRRRRLFFNHLKRRDILYLQVLNSRKKESYKCLALAKHGDLMRLDDLSIVVHFPKLRRELEFIRGDLHKFDLIRGAFWSCSVWERKLFVTVDDCIFDENEKEKIPKLGQITRKDLPYFVLCKKIGMTYAGYVQRSTGYKESGYCTKQLHECLGLDGDRLYSFYDEYDGKTYPASESFAEIRKNLQPDPSTRRLHKSYDYFKVGNMYKALHYANKAIAFNPDNIQARVTRGTVYANLGKMKKALIDTKDSLKLDSNHEAARKQMSELLISASKKHLLRGNYLQWHESLILAKKYNPNIIEAQELLEKSRYETCCSTSSDPSPVTMLIPPSIADVAPIYNRISPEVNKRRLLQQYRKERKRKHHRRRRAERHRSQQRASSMGQPIPTTTTIRRGRPFHTTTNRRGQPIPTTTIITNTTRREVFRRPSSPVFRRPFPPRDISRRS